ncbi:cathepsin S-like [Melitaea cinxia]|uniref:cathepsin S-like n=1 Tax=Melitaea cinxia TaxID=113334 RepID=UPI001E270C2F|nr:cathepsin S-like [Melitaea cinxia]
MKIYCLLAAARDVVCVNAIQHQNEQERGQPLLLIRTFQNKMILLILFIQLSLINSELHINETAHQIKYILNKYKSYRQSRCTDNNEEYSKLKNFAENTLIFFEKTERFGDYLKHYNVSDCHTSENRGSLYNFQHIVEGLLIHSDVPVTHWDEYKTAYNKSYLNCYHERTSYLIWRNNLERVAKHNQEYLAGEKSYSLHLNHFGDWHISAYIKQLLKLIKTIPLFDPSQDHEKRAYQDNIHVHRRIPKSFDWRAKGFQPRREEQWHCGACYAFAVTHALQAQLYKKHRDWRELSPQQIVDCSLKDGNLGCDGGSLQAAMRYAARDGLMMETHYPYLGKRGRCHYNSRHIRVRARRWAMLPKDENAIELALATIGPLAVAVNAAPLTFQLYR